MKILSDGTFGHTQLKMRYTTFVNSVMGCLTKTEEHMGKMEEDGWDKHPIHKDEYNILKDMHKCYSELLYSEPKSEAELDDLVWLFNNGKLRCNSEMEKRYELSKQREYREKFFEKRVGAIEDWSMTRFKLTCLLRWGMACLSATALVWFATSGSPGMCKSACSWWFLFFGMVLVYPFLFLITMGINLWGRKCDETDIWIESNRAGVKYKLGMDKIISAVTYGIVLHSTVKNIKSLTGKGK